MNPNQPLRKTASTLSSTLCFRTICDSTRTVLAQTGLHGNYCSRIEVWSAGCEELLSSALQAVQELDTLPGCPDRRGLAEALLDCAPSMSDLQTSCDDWIRSYPHVWFTKAMSQAHEVLESLLWFFSSGHAWRQTRRLFLPSLTAHESSCL